MLLALISYVGILGGFAALVFVIAAGLYYIAEFFEENTAYTKKLLVRLIFGILGAHILLLLEGFPFWTSLFALFANSVYLQTVRQFPHVSISSPSLLVGCVCAIANHFLWFRFFGDETKQPHTILQHQPNYAGPVHPPFRQIASFIGLMVWMVPLLLIVTLSAGDNTLPMAYSPQKQKPKGLLKTLLGRVFESSSLDLAQKNIY